MNQLSYALKELGNKLFDLHPFPFPSYFVNFLCTFYDGGHFSGLQMDCLADRKNLQSTIAVRKVHKEPSVGFLAFHL